MPAGLGFIVQAILGMMGSQSLLHVGALSVRLSEGFLLGFTKCVCILKEHDSAIRKHYNIRK